MSGAIEDNVFEDLYGKSCVEEGEFFLKKWANPGLFLIYFRSFQTNIITIFTTNICQKESIQYQVPGFEPTPHSHNY